MLHEVSEAMFFGQFIARTCADHDATMGHFAGHGLMHNSNSVAQFEYDGFYNGTVQGGSLQNKSRPHKQTAFDSGLGIFNDFLFRGRDHHLLCDCRHALR